LLKIVYFFSFSPPNLKIVYFVPKFQKTIFWLSLPTMLHSLPMWLVTSMLTMTFIIELIMCNQVSILFLLVLILRELYPS